MELYQPAEDTVAIETDIVYPGQITTAPRANQVDDPGYVPAETIEGLEEVGGLADWWENPEHWGSSKKYVGYGPVENKVTDPAVLEVLAKAAVVEALVLKWLAEKGETDKPALIKGKNALLELAKVEVVAAPNGEVALANEGDYESIWALWSNEPFKVVSTFAGSEAAAEEAISAEEARELVKSWGTSWKAARLDDVVVKFHVSFCLGIRFVGMCFTDFFAGCQGDSAADRPHCPRWQAPQLQYPQCPRCPHCQAPQAQEAC